MKLIWQVEMRFSSKCLAIARVFQSFKHAYTTPKLPFPHLNTRLNTKLKCRRKHGREKETNAAAFSISAQICLCVRTQTNSTHLTAQTECNSCKTTKHHLIYLFYNATKGTEQHYRSKWTATKKE